MRIEELSMYKYLRQVMNRLDIAYVATFPPRECGIATFTQDLVQSIAKFTPFSEPSVIALNDNGSIYKYPSLVKHQIAQNSLDSYYEAADYLNASTVDVVSIQHEFGIHGGQSGDFLIPFLARLKKPVVATLHTVLPQPDAHQKQIMEAIFRRAQAVVTMIDKGRQILRESYDVDIRKAIVVPHGVPNVPRLSVDRVKKILGIEDRQVLSTFGLISSGKGLEYVIRALPEIVKKHPNVVYLVIGETHPSVRRSEGEAYRNELVRITRELGMQNYVRFNNRFLPLEELITHLAATDVYITPYVQRGQIVSGTLAYAIGCGKAIVSTPYLYAEDVLAKERGLLVDFMSPEAIATGVNKILDQPRLKAKLESATYDYGRRTTWFNVAIDYLDIFDRLAQQARGERERVLTAPPFRATVPVLPSAEAGRRTRIGDGLI